MEENTIINRVIGANLLVVIVLSIIISSIMVLTTFVIFITSDSYQTVKQIQAGTAIAKSLQSAEFDTTSPIKADDITSYEQTVQQRLDTLNDNNDFGPDPLTDQSLGLTNLE